MHDDLYNNNNDNHNKTLGCIKIEGKYSLLTLLLDIVENAEHHSIKAKSLP